MGHEVGHGRGDYKGAQIDHTGALPHHLQHFVGHAFGQAHPGKGKADDHGAENEPNRRVQKVAQGLLGGADKKQGLKNPDGDGSGADGHNLEDPPDTGHEKEAYGKFAGPGELEDLAVGVHRVRKTGVEIEEDKYAQTQENEKETFPIKDFFGRSEDNFLRHLRQAGTHALDSLMFIHIVRHVRLLLKVPAPAWSTP